MAVSKLCIDMVLQAQNCYCETGKSASGVAGALWRESAGAGRDAKPAVCLHRRTWPRRAFCWLRLPFRRCARMRLQVVAKRMDDGEAVAVGLPKPAHQQCSKLGGPTPLVLLPTTHYSLPMYTSLLPGFSNRASEEFKLSCLTLPTCCQRRADEHGGTAPGACGRRIGVARHAHTARTDHGGSLCMADRCGTADRSPQHGARHRRCATQSSDTADHLASGSAVCWTTCTDAAMWIADDSAPCSGSWLCAWLQDTIDMSAVWRSQVKLQPVRLRRPPAGMSTAKAPRPLSSAI